VQAGATIVYRYAYEYVTHDKPLDNSVFVFDPAQRQRVDSLQVLMPRPQPRGAPEVGQPDQPPQLVGKPAPAVVLATADGKAFDLEEHRGRVVVLDFWASWCPPCMKGLPILHQVAKWAAQEQLPVTVMTINVWEISDKTKDNPDARLASAHKTWDTKGFTLPIAMDYTDEAAKAYGVSGIPTTVIIRSDGIVHTVHVGAADADLLKQEIQEAVDGIAGENGGDRHE
jgi:thiol-disulfide isomerase/thioredoxin